MRLGVWGLSVGWRLVGFGGSGLLSPAWLLYRVSTDSIEDSAKTIIQDLM